MLKNAADVSPATVLPIITDLLPRDAMPLASCLYSRPCLDGLQPRIERQSRVQKLVGFIAKPKGYRGW